MPSHPDGPPQTKHVLDGLVDRYERREFISDDPVSIPHAFDDPCDQEIIGLFAALLAWGRRSILLSKLAELVERMEYRPHQFVTNFSYGQHATQLAGFRHRTFQPKDAVALTLAIQAILHKHGSIEQLFASFLTKDTPTIEPAIEGTSETLFSIVPGTPTRLRKHLSRPSTGSACKRFSMYARWMVRPGPVDLGIWTGVSASQLVLPLDVHTGRQARRMGLLSRKQNDWKAVLELTDQCRILAPNDPVRYDLALFGVGAYGGQEIPL